MMNEDFDFKKSSLCCTDKCCVEVANDQAGNFLVRHTEDESKIPTEEIKNRVLFSDAIEKSVKGPKTSNNPENEESESESDDDDYSDIEDDSEEIGTEGLFTLGYEKR